jgi:hypothetical protein
VVPNNGGVSTPVVSFGSPNDSFGTESSGLGNGTPWQATGTGAVVPNNVDSLSNSANPYESQPETLSPLFPNQSSASEASRSASGNVTGSAASPIQTNESVNDVGSPFAKSSELNSGDEAGAGFYYLEMPGGEVYGPVDWNTLVAWKNQGRVGANYRVRRGENGAWQLASATLLFSTTVNPYADRPANAGNAYATPQYQYAYSRQDRSGVILTIGILSLVLLITCGPFATILGIIAWILGAQDMRAMRDGQLDPNTRGSIQAGYYLGMASTLLSVLCFGGYILVIIFSIVADANGL